nr:ATP-grasp fold amidoligase family protein [uncultured Draconibacterium sp.]
MLSITYYLNRYRYISLVVKKIKKYYSYIVNHFISDRLFIKYQFKNRLNRFPDLKNGQSFSEKIQWLKLNYREETMSCCADKYKARDYVKDKVGEKYLIPLINVYENYKDINFNLLPNQFALKATHGCGWNIICKDKTKISASELKAKLKTWQNENYFYRGREWVYKSLYPRFICEQLILDKYGQDPLDYKIFCFNGKPTYIQIDFNRFGNHTRAFYDLNWNKQNFSILHPISDEELEKPKNLNELIDVAKKLSENFPFVRVDLYNPDNKIYFGEMTFYPGNGCVPFLPREHDFEFGTLLQIP